MRTPIKVLFFFTFLTSGLFGQTPNHQDELRSIDRSTEESSRGDSYFSPSSFKGELEIAPSIVLPQEWEKDSNFAQAIDGAAIYTMAVDGDNLYLGGDFNNFDAAQTTMNAAHIVRYNRQTKKWSTLGNGFNGAVFALAVYNGKLYAGGNFTRPGNGKTSPSLQHIASWNGTSWSSIGGGLNGVVRAFATMKDGLYVGGYFTKTGNQDNPYFARWNGSKWDHLSDLNDGVNALYATGDSLYVGGNFWDGTVGLRGVGLWLNGEWDIAGGGIDGRVRALTIHKGELWIGGDFYSTWTDQIMTEGIAVYDGSSYRAPGINNSILGKAVINNFLSSGDSLIVIGTFSGIGDQKMNSVAVWKNNSWHSLGSGIYGAGWSSAIFDGALYLGGRFAIANGARSENLVAIDQNGWSNPGLPWFGYNGMNVSAIATSKDYVYVAGSFTRITDKVCNHIAAWNKHTHEWETLGQGLNDDVQVLTAYGDDLYAGGWFQQADGIEAQHIAKWNSKTKQWSALGEGSARTPNAIVANETGVYASVFFPFEDGHFSNYIGKWNGTNWTMLPGALNSYISDIEIDNSNLYVAGGITRADGIPVSGIAKFDLTTQEWSALGEGANGWVNVLKVINSTLYAGGAFSQMDGLDASYIAAWDGSSWQPLGSGVNSDVYSLESVGQDLFVGGRFSQAGDKEANCIAKWNGNNWFEIEKGADNSVLAMSADNDYLYIGGWFSNLGDSTAYRLGKYSLSMNDAKVITNTSFCLTQNYPNPFNPSTQIRYTLDERSYVKLVVTDPLGREVSTLTDGWMNAGDQEVTFNALDLPSGCYTYALTVNGNTISRKMLLSK